MGLDMYLTKQHYVKNWEHQRPEEKHKITVKKGNKVRKDIDVSKISQIVEDVAYWRKFNALHVWLVNNCADGVDDCRKVYVDKEAIRELVDTLEKVKASLDKSGTKKAKVEVGWSNGEKMYEEIDVYADTSVADELFPTQSGFFFGGTEYDKYYYDEVCEALELFKGLVDDDSDFYYQASW